MVELLLWFVIGHFIADFPFQSDWMGKYKATHWEIMVYHVLVYAAGVSLVVKIGTGDTLPIWAIGVLLLSHLAIDPLKVRYKIGKYIWLDQLLHMVVILGIVWALVR